MLFASCHGGVSPRSAHGVRIQFVKLLGTRYFNEEACTSVRVSGLIVQLLMHDTMHTSPSFLDVDLSRTAPSKSNLRPSDPNTHATKRRPSAREVGEVTSP